MSNIYALEPHTNAKVILHTTAGDIEIELWGKETPRTTRNFIQLCMEGYYDNTIFHRVVRNFIVQGGDPTGTGQGGESIYEDEEFPNEYHSRLRFTRRGLVGMANTDEGSAGSQFFFTLDRADELTKTHTLFGRVAGDTIYNVVKMGEMETDVNERPLYPPRIKSTEVVLNPFDDIVPRITERERKLARQLEMKKAAELEEGKKKKKKEKKQLNLLSFGEEAAEMEPAETTKKTTMKSSYDFLPEDKKVPAPPLPELTQPSKREENKPSSKSSKEAQEDPEIIPPKFEVLTKKSKPVEQARHASPEISEIEKLKQDIRKMERDRRDELEGVHQPEKESTKKKKSLIEEQRAKYARRGTAIVGAGKERKKREVDDTFSKLLNFQKKLSTAEPEAETLQKKERPPCKLHLIPDCESCYDTTQYHVEDETDEGWMSHKLVFEKDKKGKDLMQRTETVDDYLVIDPRVRQSQVEQEERDKRRGGEKRHRGDDSQHRKRDRDYDDDKRPDDRKRTRDDYYDRRRR